MACVACHIRVPHGGKVSRLLRAGATANVPARYRADGNGNAASTVVLITFTKSTTGSYSTSNCQITGCSSHSSAATEQW